MPDPDKATRQLKLFYVSCGNKDGLIRMSQGVHAYLKEKSVPHVWHVDDHAHDFQHWKKACTYSANKSLSQAQSSCETLAIGASGDEQIVVAISNVQVREHAARNQCGDR